MEIKTHRYPDHIFIRSTVIPVHRLTRPLKMMFVGRNGWITLVCKWSSDRDWIIKELTDD